MKAKVLGIIVCSLMTTSYSFGQCGRRYISKPVTHYNDVIVNEVVVPIAVPVIVPAFQFQYSPPAAVYPTVAAPAYPGQPTVGQPAYPVAGQPMFPGQPAPQQPFAPQQPPLAGATQDDKIRALAKALLEEMAKQSNQDEGPPAVSGGGASLPPTFPYEPNRQSPAPPAPPNVSGIGSPSGGTILTKEQAAPLAMQSLQRTCSACHTGTGSKGDTVIFTQPGIFNPSAPWRTMLKDIESGRMPLKQSQFVLTQQEVDSIRTWLAGI